MERKASASTSGRFAEIEALASQSRTEKAALRAAKLVESVKLGKRTAESAVELAVLVGVIPPTPPLSMPRRPVLSVSTHWSVDVLSILQTTLQDNYDVRLETEVVRVQVDGELVEDPVIRIYRKDESQPVLSLWLDSY